LGYGLHRQVYRLSKKGMTCFSDDWNKGKLIYWGANANYFWRINFDPKRGNIIGAYLDFGVFGQFNFSQRLKLTGGSTSKKSKFICYREVFTMGPEVRLGRENLSIYGRYKFISSEHCKVYGHNSDFDLAKWSVGLNIGIGVN
jgi:hypothetical protein